MAYWNHTPGALKGARRPPAPEARIAQLFAAPAQLSQPGWWRDDHVEQLRHYQSWVYAAVNAIAQEVVMQRPSLYVNTGPADTSRRRCLTTTPSPACSTTPTRG